MMSFVLFGKIAHHDQVNEVFWFEYALKKDTLIMCLCDRDGRILAFIKAKRFSGRLIIKVEIG
jgi:hypothetical protein